MSLQIREQMGGTPTDPLDPFAVCEHFDITVLKVSEIRTADGALPGLHFLRREPSAFSAVTLSCGACRVIVHNDAHDPRRQRSNLSHELAHCFLGHRLTPPLLANGDRDRHSGIEEEAAFLGGTLLVPNEAACHIALRSIPIEEAAQLYGVSVPMLTYRLRVSGAQQIARRRTAKFFAAL